MLLVDLIESATDIYKKKIVHLCVYAFKEGGKARARAVARGRVPSPPPAVFGTCASVSRRAAVVPVMMQWIQVRALLVGMEGEGMRTLVNPPGTEAVYKNWHFCFSRV